MNTFSEKEVLDIADTQEVTQATGKTLITGTLPPQGVVMVIECICKI